MAESTESNVTEATADTSPTIGKENYTTADVRAWANASGFEVGLRGRLKAEIVDAYRVAHAR